MAAVPRVWNGSTTSSRRARRSPPPSSGSSPPGSPRRRRSARDAAAERERAIGGLARSVVFPQILARLGGELPWRISGAAALSKDVAEFFTCLGIDIYELYGQTETSAIATTNRPGAVKLGTVGKPLAGVRLEIDRSVGDADDGSGEIVIHTPGAMGGYHGHARGDAAVKRDDGADPNRRSRARRRRRLRAHHRPRARGVQARERQVRHAGAHRGEPRPEPVHRAGVRLGAEQAAQRGASSSSMRSAGGRATRAVCGGVSRSLRHLRLREMYTREIAAGMSAFKGYGSG